MSCFVHLQSSLPQDFIYFVYKMSGWQAHRHIYKLNARHSILFLLLMGQFIAIAVSNGRMLDSNDNYVSSYDQVYRWGFLDFHQLY